ncbi:hypothetical protein [Limosilactobacillus fermentum]|uniref:hypothetical protein n=1 Tax=Limosilactobacillus fermentum TaxID=1613 RepID=UPI003B98236D
MSFLGRNKFTFIVGVIVFILEGSLKIRTEHLIELMSAVLTLAATLTAIFIGFISIIVSLGADRVFSKLDLDLIYLEKLLIGTILYLLVSFESIVCFFINAKSANQLFWFMNIWSTTMAMAFSITLSLLFGLLTFLHGKWQRRKNEDDIY